MGNLSRQLDKLAGDACNEQRGEWIGKNEVLQAELEECQQKPPGSERMVTVTQWPHRGSQGIIQMCQYKCLYPYNITVPIKYKTFFKENVKSL